MPHRRNDKVAKEARRARALDRWIENRRRGYRTMSFDPGSSRHPRKFAQEVSRKSDPEYVDQQIATLSTKI